MGNKRPTQEPDALEELVRGAWAALRMGQTGNKAMRKGPETALMQVSAKPVVLKGEILKVVPPR